MSWNYISALCGGTWKDQDTFSFELGALTRKMKVFIVIAKKANKKYLLNAYQNESF